MNELIRIDNLIAEVDGIKMLNDFNWIINQGNVQGIYVPKGSVKNVLSDILSGLHLPLSGNFYHMDRLMGYAEITRKIYTIGPQSKLVERLSIANNIFVIREGFSEQLLEDKALDQQAERLFRELDIQLSSDKLIGDLSRFEKVLVELVKAVGLGRELIVLKDCASFLSEVELEKLGDIVRYLATCGCTFLYIDSFVEMLSKLTDQVVWVKRGRNKWVFEGDIPEFLLAAEHGFDEPSDLSQSKDCVMEFRNLKIMHKAVLNLKVHRGEVINIIDRKGHSLDIIRMAICGEAKLMDDSILLEGKAFHVPNMDKAVDAGVAYINDNPTQTMLIPDLSAIDNLCYVVSRKIKGFWMRKRYKESVLERYQRKFNALNDMAYIDQMSIYDRQKLVYYKWHVYHPKIIFIYRPFSSIDRELHQLTYELIRELTSIGIAVVLLTTNETDMKIDCKRYEIESKKSPFFSKE